MLTMIEYYFILKFQAEVHKHYGSCVQCIKINYVI